MWRRCCLALLGAVPLPAQPAVAWTRGATCYEVFVRSFQDSDGDGIGDLNGLISRLDYINDGKPNSPTSLGARCIWLMPVAESPSYHGYDVSDYYRVNHAYGTNADFTHLVAEAHRRGIKVLVDLVLNHSSSEHPYFRAALRDTASPYRAWFRWSPTRPSELNPWGQSNWRKSPVRDEWYYAFFDTHMPDLNYRHPPVVAEAKKIARFWLADMHVDGFRLDAVSYLVEEPGRIMHTAGTHAVLREFERYVRAVKPGAFTVGEMSDGIEVLYGYYPDQLDSYFAFEVADSIVAAVRNGSARGLLSPLLRLQARLPRDRWAMFVRNHDQVRSRTAVGGDVRRAQLATTLLLTMPGLPFLYYGEEIGMVGSKPDERLRTPMQWSAEVGGGFTRGTPWERFQYDSLTTTVSAQEHDPASLLNTTRALVHLRATAPPLARGLLLPVTASADAVAAYLRREGRHAVLVVVNLGADTVRNVTLSSAAQAVPPGLWTLHDMRGAAIAAPLCVRAGGQLKDFSPMPALAPLTAYLFALQSTARAAC